MLRVAYEQRNTAKGFYCYAARGRTVGHSLPFNGGSDSYKEFQVTARYQIRKNILNASYVRSKAFGDLNDFNQFFGTLAQPVIQPNGRGRLAFDAPNRVLLWGEIAGPEVDPRSGLLTFTPDSLIPYRINSRVRRTAQHKPVSAIRVLRPQVSRRFLLPLPNQVKARAGIGAFNLFNHFNPRDVQSNLASAQFGRIFQQLLAGIPREIRFGVLTCDSVFDHAPNLVRTLRCFFAGARSTVGQ